MRNVLTLIANPKNPVLDPSMVAAAAAGLAKAGGKTGQPAWLARRLACDLPFAGLDIAQAQAIARAVIGARKVDAVAQIAKHRRKKLLVADMESTIIENEMLDELADFLGLRAKIAAITARAMNGEIDFAGALIERVGLLKDLPATNLDHAAKRIRLMPGAATLIATMRGHGATCALVSGGFTHFTGKIKARLGFHSHAANKLKIARGKLAGVVIAPILGKEAKLAALRKLARAKAVPIALTMSVGDGANDLPMLLAAGLGVAFRAKPSVAAAAKARIDHGDLTALLYLQGYRRSQFIKAKTATRKSGKRT